MEYKKYLPSKRFQVSLAIAILIVLIAIALTYKKSSKNNIHDLSVDSFWTDNSIEDVFPMTEEEKKAEEEYKALNPTEKIARDILSNVIANQPVNQNISQSAIDAIVKQAIDSMPQKTFHSITTISDLDIMGINNDTFTKDMNNYRNYYYTATQSIIKILDSNRQAITDPLTKGQIIKKDSLEKINDDYQKTIDFLIKTPIPATKDSNAVSLHLYLINSLEKLIGVNNDIIKASSEEDSVSVYADMLIFSDLNKKMAIAIDGMDSFLKIERK